MQETDYRRKNNSECFRPRDRLTRMSRVSSSADVRCVWSGRPRPLQAGLHFSTTSRQGRPDILTFDHDPGPKPAHSLLKHCQHAATLRSASEAKKTTPTYRRGSASPSVLCFAFLNCRPESNASGWRSRGGAI